MEFTMTDHLASGGEPDDFAIRFPRRRVVKSRSKIGGPIDVPAFRRILPK